MFQPVGLEFHAEGLAWVFLGVSQGQGFGLERPQLKPGRAER